MKLPRSTVTIAFEEPHPYAGIEVTLYRQLPLRMFFAFQSVGDAITPELVEQFAGSALVSWNLDAPATAEGILDQDVEFLATLVRKWTEVVAEPGAPLGGGSANGKPSAAPRGLTARSSRNRRS